MVGIPELFRCIFETLQNLYRIYFLINERKTIKINLPLSNGHEPCKFLGDFPEKKLKCLFVYKCISLGFFCD